MPISQEQGSGRGGRGGGGQHDKECQSVSVPEQEEVNGDSEKMIDKFHSALPPPTPKKRKVRQCVSGRRGDGSGGKTLH